ncbi:hypothetical protein OHB14_51420 [Streptomyces sp. NBC_01613]|uniref:hypothetical protein n=1 Tax=Streptomyces sp. NBC_01613 TaxID=2975896 RepID=UPI003868EC50
MIELDVNRVLVRQAHERDSSRSWLTADAVSPHCGGYGQWRRPRCPARLCELAAHCLCGLLIGGGIPDGIGDVDQVSGHERRGNGAGGEPLLLGLGEVVWHLVPDIDGPGRGQGLAFEAELVEQGQEFLGRTGGGVSVDRVGERSDVDLDVSAFVVGTVTHRGRTLSCRKVGAVSGAGDPRQGWAWP